MFSSSILSSYYRVYRAVLAVLACSLCMQNSLAQSTQSAQKALPSTLTLEGETLDKKPFQLSALKGKVTLVMFWSTDCPVCREQMGELRENVKGWADKPFELVLVSTDKNMKDVADYYALLKQVVPAKLRFTQIWAGETTYKDSVQAKSITLKQLPATYLLDKTGKVTAVFAGRIPASAWDDIAELL